MDTPDRNLAALLVSCCLFVFFVSFVVNHRMEPDRGIRGRGAAENPPNRFELLMYDRDPDAAAEDTPAPQTQFLKDSSRSLIVYNESPDIGFAASINPYRGCEHGCIYCYARPSHEYLGFSAGVDFETKILVKHDAPDILRRELASPKWQPQVIAVSGNTDCYQPIERHLGLTRRCLEVLAEFRNPVGIITKNQLVTRDIDLLQELAKHLAVAVHVSLTTLDAELARNMEPRTTQPAGRLAAIRKLRDAGIPVGVMTAPIIPGLNDHEIPQLLQAAADAGAMHAHYTILRLAQPLPLLFEQWLERHYPDRKEKVLSRIREVHLGKMTDSTFGRRMRGVGEMADVIARLHELSRHKAGLAKRSYNLSTAAFRVPGGQGLLFE
jgi:DNA repair photolyase